MWNKKLALMISLTTSLQAISPLSVTYANVVAKDVVVNSQRQQQGQITTQIKFDYPVTYDKVKTQNIKMSLLKNNEVVLTIALGEDNKVIQNKHNYTVVVVPKNEQGVELTTEEIIGSYSIQIQGVDKGDYTLKYEGDNYTTYETKVISIEDYSKDITVHTGQETFSYGDINNDNQITQEDFDLYKEAIQQGLHTADLDGDNKVDVTELTYVKHQLTSKGDEVQQDTSAILSQAVIEAVDKGIKEAGLTIENGDVSDLFTGSNTGAITIKKEASDDKPLQIPIHLGQEVETQIVEIVSPQVDGGLESGSIVVEYIEDGKTKTATQTFGNTPSTYSGVEFITRNSQRNSIVIDLGKRVPVKQIKIVVDKVVNKEGNPEYVVLEEVNFIKDILPNGPIVDVSIIKNVQVIEGDKEVYLDWDSVNNVEGYRVYYGTQSGNYTNELNVQDSNAVVAGLENLTTYYFTIRAVSGDWMGTRSLEYKATPQPSEPPKKPDFLTVEPMDRALTLKWKAAEDATYYKVFYKKATDEAYSQFIQAGSADGKIKGTSVAIGGLENNVEYELYVIAGNAIGESGQSLVVNGTPKKVELDGPELPTKNKISMDQIENIVMKDKGNIDWSQYPNGFNTTYVPNSNGDGIKNIVDGDYATHWTAQANQFHRSEEMVYTFKQPIEMNYLIYVDRLDRNYNENWYYQVTVWEDGDDLSGAGKQIVQAGLTKRKTDENGKEYYIVEFPKHNVKQISVQVEQASYSSISEIAFYKYDSLADDIAKLFNDATFTELAKGVTKDSIDVLRARLNGEDAYFAEYRIFEDELNLAEALLNKQTNKLGIIKDEIISINTTGEQKVINAWSPLGIVAGPSTNFTIYAEIPEGETLEIIPTQYYAEAGKYTGSPIVLTSGRNAIQLSNIHDIAGTKGGALYYRYSGDKADQIKLHIRDITANANNALKQIPTLELYNWYKLAEEVRREKIETYINELTAYVTPALKNDQYNPYNSTEISSRNILLSLPADQILKGIQANAATIDQQVDKLYNSLLAWEEVIQVVHTTYGLDNPLEALSSRQNIRYMRMFGSAFMYAAVSHIGIGYASASALVQGVPTNITHSETGMHANSLFGWGIAHEIGHNMDRIGKAEITNNIYSLMLQTYDGKDNTLKSRLETSNKYAEIYKKVAVGDKGLPNDVFTQLGMYWQLHLAYDEGKGEENGPLSFYNKLFKVYSSEEVKDFAGDDKFAVAASHVVEKDLTEFFTKWGMELSESAKDAMKVYQAEERKIQYLTDESRRQRLAGNEGLNKIKLTLVAKVVKSEIDGGNNKTVEITVNPPEGINTKNILGYEIFRDGKQIAFITGTTYKDYIGSANNRVFNYEVRAIDILGNVISDKEEAGDIRIEHDNVIDSDQYTLSFIEASPEQTTSSAIVIEFNKQTAVTGIKVTTSPQLFVEGNFKVEVGIKDADGNYTYEVAKSGDFSDNDTTDSSKFINYFNKPGADASDTRIWTYDADVIRITGDAITKEFFDTYKVMPLGYPGDNVAFEEYKMAIMAHDYGETEDGEPLIKEGTLVVVGSYRGNPVHNIIHIQGKFMEKNQLDEVTYVERALNGNLYMFAEVPEDGETSAISDGFFIFVPDIQKEAELQGHIDCSAVSVLPTEIMAQMYFVDDPTDPQSGRRVTSETLWYTTPSYDTLPTITLQNTRQYLMQEGMYED